jgi:hypothetical protein
MLLEIDGADVHPQTVDPRVAADLLQAFFELLGRAGTVSGVALHLRGLMIEDKCFLARSEAIEPALASKALEVASGWVNGTEQPDSQQDLDRVRRFNSLARKLGDGVTAKVSLGEKVWDLELNDDLPGLPPSARTSLRVKLVDIGVEPARARFISGSEDGPFSLTVSVEQAEELSRYLNKELDLEFTCRRDRFGKIEDGIIIQHFPMESEDGGEDWLRWLTESGKHWDDVNDPLEELGRRDD